MFAMSLFVNRLAHRACWNSEVLIERWYLLISLALMRRIRGATIERLMDAWMTLNALYLQQSASFIYMFSCVCVSFCYLLYLPSYSLIRAVQIPSWTPFP